MKLLRRLVAICIGLTGLSILAIAMMVATFGMGVAQLAQWMGGDV